MSKFFLVAAWFFAVFGLCVTVLNLPSRGTLFVEAVAILFLALHAIAKEP